MSDFPLTSYIYRSNHTPRERVTIFDVGCSWTGLGNEWTAFGSSLAGVGFDPLEAEIERLRSIENRPNVIYEAAYVGLSAEQRRARDEYERLLDPLRAEFMPARHLRHDAPGAYDSATIRPLSSSLHRRRRPTPLRTSTRPRGAVASTICSTIYANRSCQHGSHFPNYAVLGKMGAKHRLRLITTTRFTRTRHSDIVHPVEFIAAHGSS